MANEEAKNLIGYCGLNCAVCFGHKMTVSEAAKSLRREIDIHGQARGSLQFKLRLT